MAKFYGKIGFGSSVESAPGVHEQVVVEHSYYGDVIRNTRKQETGEKINGDISVGNSISIVADAYARDHFFTMKYVEWAGTRWIVTDVEVQSPRLILRLGEVYRGPLPA